MCCVDGSLILCLKGGGEVGNVGSYVCLNTVNREVEVLAGSSLKLLAADGNALDNNGKCYELVEVSAFNELVGNINSLEGLLLSADDLSDTALDLLHAVVGSSGTGNTNGHTKLDAKICNGVSIHLIGVVTAYTALVQKEEVVSGVACCLGVDTDNDTLNNNVLAFLSCHVVLKAGNCELRNLVIEGLGSSLTCCIGNSSSKNVSDLYVGLVGNVNGYGAVAIVNNSDKIRVNSPGNAVSNAADVNAGNTVEVCAGSLGIVLVHLTDVVSCSLEALINFGLGLVVGILFATFTLAVNVVVLMSTADKILDLIAASEYGESKCKNEN